MNKKLLNKVRKQFNQLFKKEPKLIFSPGRINLIGEHTDYNNGFVLPAATNKGIVLAISKSNTGISRISAINKDEIFEFEINSKISLTQISWRSYIIGVVSEIEKKNKVIDNFNAVFAGNIPSGAGMSSSAALENSFVFGLNEVFDLNLTKLEMIQISQKAEHNYVGVNCGIMDQYSSMFGEKKTALLLDCKSIKSKKYKIKLQNHSFVLINTNVNHNLSDSSYNKRRKVCELVAEKLKIDSLREATIESLNKIKNKITIDEFEKALYVLEENNRVLSFSKAIKEKNIEKLGELLLESHKGLSELYKVSCKELDFLVDFAKLNPNILGARMMGGGFGGCTLNLIKKGKYQEIKQLAMKKYKKEFGKSCEIYRVKLSKGTHLIN